MTPMWTRHREPASYAPPTATRRDLETAVAVPRHDRRPIALIIDADQDLRSILAQMLAHIGYAVVSTDNVDEACRLASERLPTLIVTDLRVGANDARVIPIELRRIPALEWIPMIVTSAWDFAGDDKLAESVGADLFTTTPVDFRAIQALAARLIQQVSRSAGD